MGTGSTIGSIIGGIGGAFLGNPMLGASLGGALGGAFDANGQQRKANGQVGAATEAAKQAYAERAPLRSLSLQRLMNPTTYDYSAAYSPQYSQAFTDAQAAQGKTLGSLAGGPDYLAQARQNLADFDTASQPQLQAAFRQVGQKAAALGRLGSGTVTTSLGDLSSDYLRNRELAKNQFISDAMDKAQADKYKTLGAASDVLGQQFGFGQAGVANRAAQIAAQNAQRNTDFGQGVGLAGLGYSGNPSDALFRGAGYYGDQANSSASDAWALASLAGTLFQRGRAPQFGSASNGGATMGSLGFGDL